MGKAGKLQETWGSCWENADRCRKHFSICKQTNSPTPKSGQSGGKYQSHDLHQMKENRLPSSSSSPHRVHISGYAVLPLQPSPGEMNPSDRFGFHWSFFISQSPSQRGQASLCFCFLPCDLLCFYVYSIISFLFFFCFVFPSPFSSFPLQFYLFNLVFLC